MCRFFLLGFLDKAEIQKHVVVVVVVVFIQSCGHKTK